MRLLLIRCFGIMVWKHSANRRHTRSNIYARLKLDLSVKIFSLKFVILKVRIKLQIALFHDGSGREPVGDLEHSGLLKTVTIKQKVQNVKQLIEKVAWLREADCNHQAFLGNSFFLIFPPGIVLMKILNIYINVSSSFFRYPVNTVVGKRANSLFFLFFNKAP